MVGDGAEATPYMTRGRSAYQSSSTTSCLVCVPLGSSHWLIFSPMSCTPCSI